MFYYGDNSLPIPKLQLSRHNYKKTIPTTEVFLEENMVPLLH